MRIVNLVRNSGIALAIFRLPVRVLIKVGNSLNTWWWRWHLNKLGGNSTIELGVKIEQPTQVSIGDNCFIGSGTIMIAEKKGSPLKIANYVHINKNVRLDHTGGLIIGEKTLISDEALIYSHSHGLDPRSVPVGLSKVIGSNVWIGVRVIILEKCTLISEGTIIAAGSIVPKSIEIPGVFAGNPARKIK